MPFTVAHAAAAHPLWRLSGRRLPVSALVVGAMSPDLEYLIFLETRRTVGHSLLGLLTLCLPLSVAVLLVWHGLVKGAVAGLVPDRWAHLAAAVDRPFPFLPWSRALLVVGGVLLGALSHVTWDAFTHSGGAVVSRVAVLRETLPVADVPVYRALQYGSGVVGMVVLAGVAVAWARRQPRVGVALPPWRTRLLGIALVAGLAVLTSGANAIRVSMDNGPTRPKVVLVAAVLGSMTGGAVGATAYGVATARSHHRR